ncbi:MAG: formylglycine-generating enzyme family protein [bacterium]
MMRLLSPNQRTFRRGWLHVGTSVAAIACLTAGSSLVRTRATSGMPASLEVPDGMVYVPAGRTDVGAVDGDRDEQPTFTARVPAFFMDQHPVTVAGFRRFVNASGHVTDAERFGDAGAFDPETRSWQLVHGATWHHPFGPAATAARDDHPVTQVSWRDAAAYAKWAGKRLPTEVEWEHAARGGDNRRSLYAWGDSLVQHGEHRANTWTGEFPAHDSGADGYGATTSPVGAFGVTALGLSDMGGNVWEWTADWYRSYGARGTPFVPNADSERALRGGSYLCSPTYCHGFRVSARSHATPESALAHTGFRTVKDLPVEVVQ